MTEGIHHINRQPIDPWGYAVMTDAEIMAAAQRLINRIEND